MIKPADGEAARPAARGSLAMMAGQGAYFVFGYLAVVILAREMGPPAYGTYGVVMSVLVWVEQSGRHGMQSAAARLVAVQPALAGDIARAALALTLGLHVALLAGFWFLAPWLAHWFGMDEGSWLFRLAAIDLPIFAAYATLQGVHQGHGHFRRLALSHALYALAKLIGVLLLLRLGISIANALILNIIASAVGVLALAPRAGVRWRGSWDGARLATIAGLALPVGAYALADLLAHSLAPWVLKAVPPDESGASVGVYVAALNVARVPGYTVSVLGVVLLPAVSRAVARGDTSSVRWYVRRAMRLLLLLYLPASLVLVREPDAVMRWIYSEPYGGGGTVLAILLVAQGGWVAHTVLAWVLVAAGETRKLSILMAAVVLLAAPLTVVLVTAAGSLGAATAYGLSGAGAATALAVLLQRRFGSVLPLLPLARIAVAGAAMFIVSVLVIDAWHPLARAAASLGVYAAVLVLLAEITWDDVAAIAAPEAAERRR